MNYKLYAMELGYMSELLENKKDLIAYMEGATPKEIIEGRNLLIEECKSINITPKSADERAKSYTVDDEGTAHIDIVGQLTPKAEKDACGAYTADALTEYGYIAAASLAADADERVERIEYFVDSPGGYVDGLMPAVQAMRQVGKPTSARVGGMAASAAYWLASQTDSIVATSELSRFGSIGVAVEEFDNTKMLENAGITRRVYTSSNAPLKRPDTSTEEGQMEIYRSLDDIESVMTQNIADGRGVANSVVQETFGRGSVLLAADAMKRGMIDKVETIAARRESIPDLSQDENPAAKAENFKQEAKEMDKDTLKAENPAVYEEVVAVGVTQERARRNAISDIMKADSDNEALKAVCEEAVEAGTMASDMAFQTKVQVAIRDGKSVKLDDDNAPTLSSESDNGVSALTEEEKAICKNLDISEEAYLKEKREEV